MRGELYPRDPEVGESVLAKTLASSLKLALTTNEALDQQLAAAKAEIERLRQVAADAVEIAATHVNGLISRDTALAQAQQAMQEVWNVLPRYTPWADRPLEILRQALAAIEQLRVGK